MQVLGHVKHRVEAEHVGEEERPHRDGAGLLDHLVDLLDVEALLVDGLPDLGCRGVEDAIYDEPRGLLAADRLLLDLLSEVVGVLHRLLGRLVALDHLDQAHHRRGVEEVEADDLLGPARGLAHLGDREGARVRAEDRVPGRDFVQLSEHRLLDAHALRHRLDHEVDVAEALVLGGAVDTAEELGGLLVRLLLGDLLLLDQAGELALGDLLRLLEALVDELLVDVLEDDIHIRGGEHLGDLSAHGASADHGGFEYEHLEIPSGEWCGAVRRLPRAVAEGYKAACSAASVANRRRVRASALCWAPRMKTRSVRRASTPRWVSL